MGVTFTRAPVVAPGEPITSKQLRGLARAFSDRIRSGLGDAAWRIGFWWLSPFRLVRNPDASGFLFPPIGEFLETYAHLDPKDATWPVTAPGEPEGANVASQMMGFIFGLEAANVPAEDIRLTEPLEGGIPLWVGTRPPETPSELWKLAKLQRGAYDPATGALSNGALWIAQRHAYLQPGSRSMHGYQFGGYLPGPSKGLDCVPPGGDEPTPINWQWTFTNTKTGAVLVYGSCPEDPAALAGGAPFYTLDNIVLFQNDGTITVLPKADWIDGPYTDNPRLRKLYNGAPERAMNAFVRDFRGPNQRPDEWTESDGWNSNAFDFQAFFTSQYLLAPARGLSMGDSIAEVYPRFRTTGLTPVPGPLRNQNADADARPVTPGFVVCGALITATKLQGATAVEILNGSTVIQTVEIEPTITGSFESIVYFDPIASGTVSVRLVRPAAFASGGFIEVELAELLEYKPQVRDAYVLLRIGGIDFGGPTDGTGLGFDRAAEIGDTYFDTGCALSMYSHPALEGSLAEANRNAVLDGLRRLSRCVRFVKAEDVLGYAVEAGKSVLWIRRHTFGLGGTADLDMFGGIADAIAHEAPPGGATNEWVATIDFKALRVLDTSIWKPDIYSKFWPVSNRCQLLDPDIAIDPISRWHFSYGQRFTSPFAVPIAESPSGYTYAQYGGLWTDHINTKICADGDTACEDLRADFYRSCRIYETPPEIESAETVVEGGDTLVKLTFKTRFHHDAGAPGSIARDVGTWDLTALGAEPYRTWENGIREFLVHRDSGSAPSLKTGDRSVNYTPGVLLDEPWGSIWPEIILVQLPREPYSDGSDEQDSQDTPFWHDELTRMEVYLHAMAPGYVDGKVSMDSACANGTSGAFDFSFESLCAQAFGGRWFTTMPSVPTDYIPEADVRPDTPQGFGPLANTRASSELFNQFSKSVNLLTTLRVMLPSKLETRDGTSSNQYVVDPHNAAGDLVSTSVASSSLGSDYAVWIDLVARGGGAISWSGWADSDPTFASTRQATLIPSALGEWSIKVDERIVEWRWTLIDPDALEAIPELWRGNWTDNGAVLAFREINVGPERRKYVPVNTGRQCHDGLIVSDTVWNGAPGGQAIDFEVLGTPTVTCEPFALTGQLSAPPLPYSTHWASDMVSTNPSNFCNGGPVTYDQLTPLNRDTALIVIPLVDPPSS